MNFRCCVALLLACALSAFSIAAQAQDTAAVATTSGTVTVQKADGSIRSLAPGSMVQAGDLITTQSNSSARLKFTDGGELTVSSNSQLKIDAYHFNTAAPKDDNLAMSLLKGGLRNITGLISRRGNRDAYRLQTTTATIGIRGTDFIARVCEADCEREIAQAPGTARAITPDIAARVAILAGQAVAIDRTGASRPLKVGSAIYQGDLVETRAQSHAVLVFLDQGRVTLQPETRFAVERFRYEPARPGEGSSVVRLLKGGMRALTGLVAKNRPQSYEVQTVVATIGIRGTGFDAFCTGACVSDGGPAGKPPPKPAVGESPGGLFVNTWQDAVIVKNAAGSQTVGVGETVQVTGADQPPLQLPEAPPFMRDAPGPRPDGIEFNMQQLFGGGTESQSDPGLYVLVKDGRILLVQDTRMLELERGESAFASLDRTQLYRLQFTPTFLERDNVLSAPGAGALFCGFGFR